MAKQKEAKGKYSEQGQVVVVNMLMPGPVTLRR